MVNDLRKKSNKELGDLIIKLKNQLLEYRFKAAVGQLDKTHKIRIVKKTIAVSFSILSERNVNLSLSSHNCSLIEIKDGKTITTSIGQGLMSPSEELLIQDKDSNSKNKKTKEVSKKLSENNLNQKDNDVSKKNIGLDAPSKKTAPKKIVTKSNNNQTKKTNIVKKAQRGV